MQGAEGGKAACKGPALPLHSVLTVTNVPSASPNKGRTPGAPRIMPRNLLDAPSGLSCQPALHPQVLLHPLVNLLRCSEGQLERILVAIALIRLLRGQVRRTVPTVEASRVCPKPPRKAEPWLSQFPRGICCTQGCSQMFFGATSLRFSRRPGTFSTPLLVGRQGSGRVGCLAEPFAVVCDVVSRSAAGGWVLCRALRQAPAPVGR